MISGPFVFRQKTSSPFRENNLRAQKFLPRLPVAPTTPSMPCSGQSGKGVWSWQNVEAIWLHPLYDVQGAKLEAPTTGVQAIFQMFARRSVLNPVFPGTTKIRMNTVFMRIFVGGPEGIRTLGLCDANAALSQLSYGPVKDTFYNVLVYYITPFCACQDFPRLLREKSPEFHLFGGEKYVVHLCFCQLRRHSL